MHIATIMEDRDGWPVAIDVNVIHVHEDDTPVFAFYPHTTLPVVNANIGRHGYVMVSLQ